ncbi:MAG: virulence protein RhuM/Fic/DOC family protein [Proteobacteria bacterium]|nr:virulence protein RhuM/Fic/DOC family protein [Pseudomonadota bacterium]MBU1638879.1 virulence protein RhuM/Fic/DOC family protein [Pseudomonadota bacterium]
MQNEYGEVIIYQAEDGKTSLEVQLRDETVWLSQAQLVEFFAKTKQNISLHIRNIFKEGELVENSVVKEYLTTAADGKKYRTKYYNLDVIISVGYRVKSQRGTQFRIWATSVLKDHLIKGYTVNERRLAETGLTEMEQAIALLTKTLESHESLSDEGRAVLQVISRYAKSWSLLLKYDEDRLELPKSRHPTKQPLDYDRTVKSIMALKNDLLTRGEATELFGQQRGDSLQGILGNLDQTFGGQDLYPSLEDKAAHLLYFVIKDHPFSDGNKRIGSFLFLVFLQDNNLLEQSGINDNGLVALALLIAESDPKQKDLMIRLIMNMLARGDKE